MQCPSCQTGNREGSRFCAECGTPLAAPCPDCGFANYPNAKFCGGCGKTLSAPSAQKREGPEPERRQLTVMFCDLVGSTALAERLDPEELRDLLAQYQQTCADVIQRFDGHIARYVGDGLLVYFGYPQAHEDDAQRGVRAGLGIVGAIRDLDAKIANPDVSLAVRIGITTGLVVAGDIGGGGRVEQNAIVGETPNLAARLQALAEPNTVVIGVGTHRLVEGLFDCDDLGPQALKGISEAVLAYRVRQESGVPSRFEASAIRGLTALVGRESEIGLLVNRWEQVKEGEGQVVLLSGEAGIGKSRIVRAFRDHLEAEPHNRVLYYGSPYHQNSALYPIIDQLERGLRFEKDDSAARKLEKLDAVLGDLGLPVAEYAPVLASLLSVPADGRYPPLELDPEQLKKKTLNAIITMIQAMSSQHPVLMVVEDTHWIDPSTQELTSLLIEQLQSYRLFLLITCRPEFESSWDAYAHITSLTLNRLSQRDSTTMIGNVTAGKALPNEVLDQIVNRTDGVPLFIEELTKIVLESDLLQDTGDRYALSAPLPAPAIPASLQDSLMARLDRLGPGKHVAQVGATIGRDFTGELLRLVSDHTKSTLEKGLKELVDAGLVFRRGIDMEGTYTFKHALVQDAAYSSQLRRTRRQLHARIAGTLETAGGVTMEATPELLAHHFTEAANYEKAVDYWRRAVERATKRSAFREAQMHANKGLEVLTKLPRTLERSAVELSLLLSLGVVQQALTGAGSVEVERIYTAAHDLCEEVGEPWQRFSAVWGLWRHHESRADYPLARRYADELLAVARNNDDAAFLLQAHHAHWTTAEMSGDLPSACQHAEEGLRIYKTDEHAAQRYVFGGHDPAVCALGTLATVSWLMGYPDRAMHAIQSALTRARELNHPSTLTNCLTNTICHYMLSRQSADLIQAVAQEISEIASRYGFSMYSAFGTIARGWSMVELESLEGGIAKLNQGLSELKATGRVAEMPLFRTLLAEALFRSGKIKQGLDVVSEGLSGKSEDEPLHLASSEEYRMQGKLLQSSSGISHREAETWFHRALECAHDQQARSLELRAAVDLAHLQVTQGKDEAAVETLKPVYDHFTEGFDTADLREAKALLESLS